VIIVVVISYREALQIIADAERLPVRELPLSDAAGRVSAAAVASRLDVPDFDNAAMDGFALRAVDCAGASESDPKSLTRIATVAAGDAPGISADTGEAVEIMTGAPLPAGCDAVVPVEQAEVSANEDLVRFACPARSGQNVRRRGEDFPTGTLLLEPGKTIGAAQLMALAAGGLDQVPVRGPVRVAIVATGAELAEQGAPSGSGAIRDANGPYLRSALPDFGAQLAGFTLTGDQPADVSQAISAATAGADLVITTGGVSAGRYDAVPAAVNELGGEILFHKVSIRPGKPILFARLNDGRYLLGLPGNPVAVAAGLRFFGAPLLRRLTGQREERWPSAITLGTVRKRPGPRFFAKARASLGDRGQLQVEILPGQESFRILPLTHANCWAIVEEGREQLPAGETVRIAPLVPGHWPGVES
jgi:molybdopterin molybdotransferase